MRAPLSTCFVGVILLVAAACSAISSDQPGGTETPTSTAQPATATAPEWFPLSATPSPEAVPTRQPTPEMKPGMGSVLLKDDFSSTSQWHGPGSNQVPVAIAGGGLTIAAQPGTTPVVIFRTGAVQGDMFAEVTARPSLCRGADDYGLLFRASDGIAYYRFAVACNGTEGAARISLGGPRALQPPIPSGDAPLGAPGEVRLGIWTAGSEFRFFLNDRYQFTAIDKSYSAGELGLFVRAAGSSPVAVTFSDLVVYDVSYSPPTLTPMP